MTEHNPYSAPESDVAVDISGDEQYQPKIFTAQGRIGRMRYWVYNMLITLVLYLIMGLGFGALMATGSLNPESGFEGFGVIGMVLYVVVIVVGLVAMFVYAKRRLNDVNKSGWFSLLMLVPLVNLLMYLYLLFAKGTQGNNQYGQQPVPNSAGVKVGFGLSLLLFVVGILAAIALPAYQGYVMQAEMQVLEFPAE